MKVGYIEVSKELFDSSVWIDFLPEFQRVFKESSREYFPTKVKLTGTCDLFEEVKEGQDIPQYVFTVMTNPEGKHYISDVNKA